MTATELHTRAMLVSLRISAWSARKYDRKVSQETATAHNTTIDAGRYNKCLLPGDAASFKALTSFVSNLRVINYSQTLPWSDDGWRLLPVKNYTAYTDVIRTSQHEFNRLLEEFAVDYPSLRESARLTLNGMYSDTDYPSDIRGRYDFSVEYSPVPCGTDFRVSLAATEIEAIAARTEQRVTDAFNAAMTGKDGAVDRLRKVVSSIIEKCSSPDAIFRDSLIGNARELCNVLTRLNVTDDPILETLRQQTETLSMVEPETLRRNDDVRAETAKQAQSILDAMTATYGTL